MTVDPVERYVRHARKFGVEGLAEVAVADLDDRQLERLRKQLLADLGQRVVFRKSAENLPQAKGETVTQTTAATTTQVPPETVTPARKCVICGKGLGGRHSQTKTCSPRCRVALHRRNEAGR